MPRNAFAQALLAVLAITLSLSPIQFARAESSASTGDEFRKAHRSARQAESVVDRVNRTTGMAPSPLMVMGVGGARRYFQTPEAERQHLGFFALPWVWVTMIFVVILVGLKDTLSSFAGPLKPALDSLAELVHAGGYVLGIGFLAFTIYDTGEVQHVIANDTTSLEAIIESQPKDPNSHNNHQTAESGDIALETKSSSARKSIYSKAINFATSSLLFACAIVVYTAVWITFNMIEAFILVNPIPWIEHLLKGSRAFIIGIITAADAIHPLLGFAVSVPIILVCFYLAHFATRLTVMALVYSVGMLRRIFIGGSPYENATLWAFSSRHFSGVGLFSFGYLRRTEDGSWEFVYKRLFLFFTRCVPLPNDLPLAIGVGSVNPYVIGVSGDGKQRRIIIRFSPRYLRFHEHLRSELNLSNVVDISLVTSIKRAFTAVGQWIRAKFARKPARPVARPVRRIEPRS